MFVLVTMTLSLAESAGASVCASPLLTGMAVAASMADMPGMPPARDRAAADPGHQKSGDAPQTDCPFGPVTAGTGCAFSASIPAPAVLELNAPAARTIELQLPTRIPDSILSAPLFPPPKL